MTLRKRDAQGSLTAEPLGHEFAMANRRLGKMMGAKRESPTGNPSPAPTHPHRTHDTTDQWREIREWLARFLRHVILSGSRRVQRPIVFKDVVVQESLVL